MAPNPYRKETWCMTLQHYKKFNQPPPIKQMEEGSMAPFDKNFYLVQLKLEQSSEHLHSRTPNKAPNRTLEAQIIPCGAYAVWSVPLLLRDFAGIFAGFGNLGLGWEKSDHHDDTWHCGTDHKRKGTWS